MIWLFHSDKKHDLLFTTFSRAVSRYMGATMFCLAWMSSGVLYWVASRFLDRLVWRKCYSYNRKTRSVHCSKQLFIQGHESGNLSMQTCCGVIWWLSLVVFCAAHEYRPSFLFFTLSQKQSSLPVACTRQLGCLPATLDRYTNTHDSLEQCLYSGLWRSGMIPLCRVGRVSTGLSSPSSPDSLFCPPASSTPAPN